MSGKRETRLSLVSATDCCDSLVSWIVIPARMASTRLPRKLMLRETGKTLIQHTFEAAQKAKKPQGIVIATDHEEIFREVESFGGRAVMTDPNLPSGTDRVAEVARQMPEVDLFVNVQGDEPEISGEAIDSAIEMLERNPSVPMATLGTPIRSREKLDNPACVKVVFDSQGQALYFSRSPIPHPRQWEDSMTQQNPPLFHQHIGLYAYRRDFLLKMAQLPPSRLENTEKLEQLRVLEAGYSIAVAVVEHAALGIDTADEYRAFVSRRQAG